MVHGPMGSRTTIDRLLSRRVIVGECWEWEGSRNKQGYGRLKLAGKYRRVHRVMADLVGLTGTGPQVLHTCDNPPCFNPAHLFRGTQQENAVDEVSKGRHPKTKVTHCPAGHPYTADNTYTYMRNCRPMRICKICTIARVKARYRRA